MAIISCTLAAAIYSCFASHAFVSGKGIAATSEA